MHLDFWYGNTIEDVEAIDVFFGDVYRGNMYSKGKTIGDYSTDDSTEIEKVFGGKFEWIG